MDILDGFQKLASTQKDDLDLDWSRLSRPPRLKIKLNNAIILEANRVNSSYQNIINYENVLTIKC